MVKKILLITLANLSILICISILFVVSIDISTVFIHRLKLPDVYYQKFLVSCFYYFITFSFIFHLCFKKIKKQSDLLNPTLTILNIILLLNSILCILLGFVVVGTSVYAYEFLYVLFNLPASIITMNKIKNYKKKLL